MTVSSCCGETRAKSDCGCGSSGPVDGIKAHYIIGFTSTPAGNVPLISTRLVWKDIRGSWKARWGIGRMNYRIRPGLYGVGRPYATSPVFVTANYKMSFDRLRREIPGLDAWVLVLDTQGINVWCAAGKGTFGTEELIQRVFETGLAKVVDHLTLILPQLGAVGVAAHEVKRATGFKVVYGPVRAADIPEFMEGGMQASPAMRTVKFSLWDRLILTPVELTNIVVPVSIALVTVTLLNAFAARPGDWGSALIGGWVRFWPILGAVLTGAVLTPVLLPWIPGRMFAWKGWLLGLLWAVMAVWGLGLAVGPIQTGAFLLGLPAISAFLAMNFTGASTFTSLSGVVREMKIAVPVIKGLAGVGAVLWIIGLWVRG